MKSVTCIAPVNIAVIKYWGKRDEELILPINDSLSGTLSTDQMCAKTSVAIDPSFSTNRIWLNGKEETFDNKRLQNCLSEIKKRAEKEGKFSSEELSWNVHICSENNFPTAAGLASSAAGYACLVYSLAKLYGISGEISSIARQGSGSACRSIYGGFVAWVKGQNPDGSDSVAEQIVDENYWPQMRVIILVVSDNKKKTSSTSGMGTSVLTSELLKFRASTTVPLRMNEMKDAILNKNFHHFAELTIKDSNQFHAVCLDTYPPCVYMNDISHSIAQLVHSINRDAGKNIVAYTFDAGPNACLYLLEENVSEVLGAINHVFPTTRSDDEYLKGLPIDKNINTNIKFPSVLKQEPMSPDSLRYIIHTKIGEGPKVVDSSLLGPNGLPK